MSNPYQPVNQDIPDGTQYDKNGVPVTPNFDLPDGTPYNSDGKPMLLDHDGVDPSRGWNAGR